MTEANLDLMPVRKRASEYEDENENDKALQSQVSGTEPSYLPLISNRACRTLDSLAPRGAPLHYLEVSMIRTILRFLRTRSIVPLIDTQVDIFQTDNCEGPP